MKMISLTLLCLLRPAVGTDGKPGIRAPLTWIKDARVASGPLSEVDTGNEVMAYKGILGCFKEIDRRAQVIVLTAQTEHSLLPGRRGNGVCYPIGPEGIIS